MKKYCLLLFALLIAAVPAFAEDAAVSDWISDVTYIAQLHDTSEGIPWLASVYSDYDCEGKEQGITICELDLPSGNNFVCSFTFAENEESSYTTAAAKCETEKAVSAAVVAEYYDALKTSLEEALDDFIAYVWLHPTDDSWNNAIKTISEEYSKTSSYSYYLFGTNIVVTSWKTAAGGTYLAADIFPLKTILSGNTFDSINR